jgi:hypothetical protein
MRRGSWSFKRAGRAASRNGGDLVLFIVVADVSSVSAVRSRTRDVPGRDGSSSISEKKGESTKIYSSLDSSKIWGEEATRNSKTETPWTLWEGRECERVYDGYMLKKKEGRFENETDQTKEETREAVARSSAITEDECP